VDVQLRTLSFIS